MCRVPVHDPSVLRADGGGGRGESPGKSPFQQGKAGWAAGPHPGQRGGRPGALRPESHVRGGVPSARAPGCGPGVRRARGRGGADWSVPTRGFGPGETPPVPGFALVFSGSASARGPEPPREAGGSAEPRLRARNKSPPGAAASGGATARRLRVPIRSRSESPRGKRPLRSPVPPVPGAHRRLEAPQSDSRPGRRPPTPPRNGPATANGKLTGGERGPPSAPHAGSARCCLPSSAGSPGLAPLPPQPPRAARRPPPHSAPQCHPLRRAPGCPIPPPPSE
ncbi:basic proline-rich protein-like [Enhydra lutris kenyoni]|uniref:Basic proline-rich protein-like n=1 Tax=Enhydra lutris kenyoni TaxID=391180 RepID=A0A2Y9L5Q0_ENHLU|nr:basic proline-rich protein-like [Enhydra lutris kenyoni]